MRERVIIRHGFQNSLYQYSSVGNFKHLRPITRLRLLRFYVHPEQLRRLQMAVACPRCVKFSNGNVTTMTNWYCIYTKPNHEGPVAQRLGQVPGIEVLTPRLKTKKMVRGRLRWVTEELFPSYIFSRFNPEDYYSMIKYTRGIRRIIGDLSGSPYVVDDEIIWQIQSRIKDGLVHIDKPDFSRGDHILIQEGPLKGLAGVFQQDLKARDRVLVLLNMIEYQASIEIDREYLEKA